MRDTFQLARERLAIITGVIGDVVGSVIAVTFYFTMLIPFALIAKFSSDPLQRKPDNTSHWLQRDPVSTEIDRAKRQG